MSVKHGKPGRRSRKPRSFSVGRMSRAKLELASSWHAAILSAAETGSLLAH